MGSSLLTALIMVPSSTGSSALSLLVAGRDTVVAHHTTPYVPRHFMLQLSVGLERLQRRYYVFSG